MAHLVVEAGVDRQRVEEDVAHAAQVVPMVEVRALRVEHEAAAAVVKVGPAARDVAALGVLTQGGEVLLGGLLSTCAAAGCWGMIAG